MYVTAWAKDAAAHAKRRAIAMTAAQINFSNTPLKGLISIFCVFTLNMVNHPSELKEVHQIRCTLKYIDPIVYDVFIVTKEREPLVHRLAPERN